MLAYVSLPGQGEADRFLRDLAKGLRDAGVSLAGAVQVNADNDPGRKCHMDLHILSGSEVIRISQDLGALSSGCRLDPAGLESAAGLVLAALDKSPALLILNKFGKQECLGRGFRPVIAEALLRDIPVLVAVSPGNLPDFLTFAGEMAEPLPADAARIRDWLSASVQP